MVIVGLVSFLLINWVLHQRHVFKGPNLNLELLQAARHDELLGNRVIDGVAVGDESGILEALRQRSISQDKKM